MAFPEPVVRLLAGSGAADRTHERRTRRLYAGSDVSLKQVTEVTREVVPSPPRTFSRMTDALPRRNAPRTSPQPEPDPALVRQLKGLPPEQGPPKGPIFNMPPDISASDISQNDIQQAHTVTDDRTAKDFDADLPALPEMEGFGKYRMAKNASDEHRISHLRRTTSELTPPMVEQIARLDLVDARLLREAATRTESPSGSYASSASAPARPSQCFEYIDTRRGSLVKRGFSPSTPSSVSSSMNTRMLQRRKDSSISASSMSSVGEPKSQRKNVRQASLPIIQLPQQSALSAIKEDGASCKTLPKTAHQLCSFEIGPDESAIASDEEEDWADEMILGTAPRPTSALSEGLTRTHKRSGLSRPPLVMPPGQPPEAIKPRQVSRGLHERGRQMRPPTRVALKRDAPPNPFASRRLRFEEAPAKPRAAEDEEPADNQEPDGKQQLQEVPKAQNVTDFASTWESMSSGVAAPDAASTSAKSSPKTREVMKTAYGKGDLGAGSDEDSEADDAPADLALFMVEPRRSIDQDDDEASTPSGSTPKTSLPWHQKVYSALTMRPSRKRAATIVPDSTKTSPSQMTEKNTNEAAD